MNILQHLRQVNPNLKLCSVLEPAFAPYGRVLPLADADSLAEAMRRTEIPAQGNLYRASVAELEAQPAIGALERTVYGGMPIQAGFCNGRGFRLNAEEYHKCSEVNFSTTGLVLLLALPSDLKHRHLDSSDVVGFFLPPETAVEIYPRVLHFAPCRISESGFNCLVVLTRGTNEPLVQVDSSAAGEEGLLWARNKWLICHPDSPQAEKGAFLGITGENLSLSI